MQSPCHKTPPPRWFRLIVFDCDGTLVDSQHGIVAAMTAAWRAHRLADPDPAAVRGVVGLNLETAVAALLPAADAAMHRRLVIAYRAAFLDLRTRPDHEEPLFPGIGAALAALDHPAVLFGIATGKGRRGLLATLERHDLVHRFATLQTADTCPGKPHPEMLRRAMAETGTAPAATVLVGDTTFDMEMAANAGTAAIGVGWGYHEPAALRAAGADRVVARPADLPAALLSLKGDAACA